MSKPVPVHKLARIRTTTGNKALAQRSITAKLRVGCSRRAQNAGVTQARMEDNSEPPHPGSANAFFSNTHTDSKYSSLLPPPRAPFANAVRRCHCRHRSKGPGRQLSVPVPGPGKPTRRRRCAQGSREPHLSPLRQGQARLGCNKKKAQERSMSKERQRIHYQAAMRITSKCRRKSRVCPVSLWTEAASGRQISRRHAGTAPSGHAPGRNFLSVACSRNPQTCAFCPWSGNPGPGRAKISN